MKKRNLLLFISSALLALSMSACTVETGLSQSSSGSDSKSSEKQSSGSTPAQSSDASSEEGSSEEEQQSSSEESQVVSEYSYSLNGNPVQISGEPSTDHGEEDTWVYQYAVSMNVTAGDALLFYKGNQQLDVGASGTGNNASYSEETHGLTVRSTAENATAYLKIYDNDGVAGYDVWLTGYSGEVIPPEPQVPHGPEGSELASWYLVGQGSIFTTSWSIEGGVQLYTNPDSENDKGCILGLTVAVGDKFKVTNGLDKPNDIWFGYEKVDTWEDPANKGLSNFQGSADGYGGTNFECTVAGTYDMYINGSGVFWIQDAA